MMHDFDITDQTRQSMRHIGGSSKLDSSSESTNLSQLPTFDDPATSMEKNDIDTTLLSDSSDLIMDNATTMEEECDNSTPDENINLDSPEMKQDSDEESEGTPPNYELPKYQLRPQNCKLKPAFARTWIDTDETGNYGDRKHSEDLRRARLRRNRAKIQQRDNDRCKADDSAENEADNEGAPEVIPKLMVILGFRSEAGGARYRELILDQLSKNKGQSDENAEGYQLRRRSAAVNQRYYGDCNLDKSRFAPDLPEDLTGHPLARGCWECLGLGIKCPLLDDERAWPCKMCLDDDHDCDLVTPPVLKRACERCKRRRMSCSFSYSMDQGETCQHCMEDGYRCVAGPAKEAIRLRIRYDRDWIDDPLPKKKTLRLRTKSIQNDDPDINVHSSTTSRASNSFLQKYSFDGGKIRETGESFVYKSLGEKRRLEDPSPATRPAKTQRTPKQTEAVTQTIRTRFCHPITFNHEDKTDGNEPCHFCAEPGYAIVGLGAKEVEVIEWEGGQGLEEVCGGHKDEGVESTRVCATCTLKRLRIVMCPTHELRPSAGVKKCTLDENAAFAELLAGSSKAGKRQWCAICPSLAVYECGTRTDDGSHGCGLRLCEQCAVVVTGSYDGDLQNMLPEMKDEPTEERMLGLRADYELLREDGLLMQYVLWSSGQ